MSNLLHTRALFTRSSLIKTYKLTDLFELARRSTFPMDMAKHMSPLAFGVGGAVLFIRIYCA